MLPNAGIPEKAVQEYVKEGIVVDSADSAVPVAYDSSAEYVEGKSELVVSGRASLAADKGTITFSTANANHTLTQAEVTKQINAAGIGSGDTFAAAFDSSVQIIATRAFSNCTTLTEVTIPSGLTSIENASNYANGAFYGCTKLAKVNFEGSTDIGN